MGGSVHNGMEWTEVTFVGLSHLLSHLTKGIDVKPFILNIVIDVIIREQNNWVWISSAWKEENQAVGGISSINKSKI